MYVTLASAALVGHRWSWQAQTTPLIRINKLSLDPADSGIYRGSLCPQLVVPASALLQSCSVSPRRREGMEKPVTVSGIIVASGEIASGELVDGVVVEQPSADSVQRKVHGLLRDGLQIVSVAEGESYMRSLTTEQKAVGKWAGYHLSLIHI